LTCKGVINNVDDVLSMSPTRKVLQIDWEEVLLQTVIADFVYFTSTTVLTT